MADFYTWTNKSGTYDIGGMYYVFSPQKTSLFSKARDKYYKYLTYYIETFGSENLLEVDGFVDENCSVNNESFTYELNGESYKAYSVKLEWTYKNEDTFSELSTPTMDGEALGFAKWNYFTVIINEDGRYEIVQAWGEV